MRRRFHPFLMSVVMVSSFVSTPWPASADQIDEQNVTLSTSRSIVDYGMTVTLTAHLVPYQVTPNKIVSIRQQPYGGSDAELASGPLDEAGNLSAVASPSVNTSFYALWSGDGIHDPSRSDNVIVRVRVIIRASLTGSFGRSGQFQLYHFTWNCPKLHQGCPTYTVEVTPSHAEQLIYFRVQRYGSGAWRTILDFHRALDAMSSQTVSYVYSGPGAKNSPFRIRSVFKDDADHVGRAASWSYFQVVQYLTIETAGDIACSSGPTPTTCHQAATSDILVTTKPTAVLPLGDNQYWAGELWAFRAYYRPSWGRLKAITHPSPGNHEYLTKHAAGYFTYFGSPAGDPRKGYYSFDVGAWHVIALNSEINHGSTSRQVVWLKADLSNHPVLCTLAYWHRPRWTSGWHGNDPSYGAFWRVLYRAHADVVLNGHDHDYERFALQAPSGATDTTHGIREFVVGTGGSFHRPWARMAANSQARNDFTFGVLRLRLRRASYVWKFLPEAGKRWTDYGSTRCH